MGTKIQSKMHSPGYYSLRDPNYHGGQDNWLLNHNNGISKDGKYDVFMTGTSKARFMEWDKEQVRQTILKHESIFRHQLNELHRVYRVQRELMSKMKRNATHKHSVPAGSAQTILYSSSVPSNDQKMRFWSSNFSLGNSLCSISSPSRTIRIQTPLKLMNGMLIQSKCCPSNIGVDPSNFQSSESEGKNFHRQLFDLGLPAETERKSGMKLGLSGASGVETWPCTGINEISQKRNVDFAVGGTVNGRSTEISFCNPSDPDNFHTSFKTQSETTTNHVATAPIQFEERKTGQQCKRKLFGVEIPQTFDVHVNRNAISAPTSRAEIHYLGFSKGLELAFHGSQVSHPSISFVYSNGMSNSNSPPGEQHIAMKYCGAPEFMINVKSTNFPDQNTVPSNRYQVGLGFQQNRVSVHSQRKQDCSQEDQELQHCNGDSLKEKKSLDVLENPNTSVIDKGSFQCLKNDSWLAVHVGNSEHESEGGMLQHQIDLNLCPIEETTSMISTEKVESDLEAPGILKNEMIMERGNYSGSKNEEQTKSLHHVGGEFSKELITIAAETLVAISSSHLNHRGDNIVLLQSDSWLDNPLIWFADIICSHNDEHQNEIRAILMDEDSFCDEDQAPDGLDFFEYMTLKLTKTEVGERHFNSAPLQNTEDEKATTKQLHRGHARRGRQRKDFQRDVLPGLTCLSKYEVTQDLHLLEGLVRATGGLLQSRMAQRNAAKVGSGRGRKHSGGAAPAITKNSGSQTLFPQPPCTDLAFTQGSLTRWGKRIRRLPRHRGPLGNPSVSLN